MCAHGIIVKGGFYEKTKGADGKRTIMALEL